MNVIVQVVDPDPVAVVLLVVPVKIPYCVPEAAALLRLVKQLVISVFRLLKIAIVFPVTGAGLEVIEVPW